MPQSELLQLDPTSPDFVRWLTRKGFRKPKATVLHHTWSPTATQYKGLPTIRGIERYHMQNRGYSTIAANGYACPDGTIVTGRNLSYGNWAHALIQRADVEAEARKVAGGDKLWFNRYAYGLETVANFDSEPTHAGKSGRAYETALRVLTVVHRTFSILPTMLFFHRDVAHKTCPGTRLSRDEVRRELARRLGLAVPTLTVKVNGQSVAAAPAWSGDMVTVLAAPVLSVMGAKPVNPAIHGNGRAYLRELIGYCDGWRIGWDPETLTASVEAAG